MNDSTQMAIHAAMAQALWDAWQHIDSAVPVMTKEDALRYLQNKAADLHPHFQVELVKLRNAATANATAAVNASYAAALANASDVTFRGQP